MRRVIDWCRNSLRGSGRWDIVPLGVVVLLAIQALGAIGGSEARRTSQPVRVTLDRNGENGTQICRRYDVPAELCDEIEINGNRAILVLDPNPVRPAVPSQD